MDFKKIESSLKKLSETELALKTKSLAKQEQELNLVVLYHLQEVYRRKYYARLGYSSVWEYCVKELGYCEAGASHRVQVMKLMFTHKEAKKEIENKNLSLSQAVKITQFLTREKKETGEAYSTQKTSQLISAVKNKSVRETITHLQRVERARKEPLWEKSNFQTVSFDADDELIKMMERLRELKGNMATREMMKFVFHQTLLQIDPLVGKARKNRSRRRESVDRKNLHLESAWKKSARNKAAQNESARNKAAPNKSARNKVAQNKSARNKVAQNKSARNKAAQNKSAQKVQEKPTSNPSFRNKVSNNKSKQSLNTFQVAENSAVVNEHEKVSKMAGTNEYRTVNCELKKPSRYIPKRLRQTVAIRSRGQCEFISSITQKRCESRYRLQVDHAKPLSRGGETKGTNLQHLCPTHNSTKGTQEMWFFKPADSGALSTS